MMSFFYNSLSAGNFTNLISYFLLAIFTDLKFYLRSGIAYCDIEKVHFRNVIIVYKEGLMDTQKVLPTLC